MGRYHKTLAKVLEGRSDANIRFADLRYLLTRLGFTERTGGGHCIFAREDVVDILNLQPMGSKAKAYQVRQVRDVIKKYRLASDEEDE